MEIDTRDSKETDAITVVAVFIVGLVIGGALLWAIETYADQPKPATPATPAGGAGQPPDNAKPTF